MASADTRKDTWRTIVVEPWTCFGCKVAQGALDPVEYCKVTGKEIDLTRPYCKKCMTGVKERNKFMPQPDTIPAHFETSREREERAETIPHSQDAEADTGDTRPDYYDENDPYEPIKVAEAWGLDKDAYLFTALKYIARRGRKPGGSMLKDIRKARTYLGFRIRVLERESTV